MYCPKCGAENQGGNLLCENCGFVFYKEEQPIVKEELPVMDFVPSKEIVPESPQLRVTEHEEMIPEQKKMISSVSRQKIMGLFLCGTAAFILVLSVIAAIFIFFGGSEISQIQSVGGKTLEEAYYKELKYIYNGHGILALSVGTFCSSILVFLGFRSFSEK